MEFDDRPYIAIWEVTQACDLACVHCRARAYTVTGNLFAEEPCCVYQPRTVSVAA